MSNVNSLASTGQLIAFLVGLFSLLSVVRNIWAVVQRCIAETKCDPSNCEEPSTLTERAILWYMRFDTEAKGGVSDVENQRQEAMEMVPLNTALGFQNANGTWV